MSRLLSFFILLTLAFSLEGCVKTTPRPQPFQIGSASRIEILTPRTQFYKNNMPRGWVIEGTDSDKIFDARTQIPSLYMTQKEGIPGLHVQTAQSDFILARYTQANLLVSPYLVWNWYVSENKTEHHPVRLLIGFYGGNPKSPPLNNTPLIWTGNGLPPYDRLIAIGFEDMALKRGNLYEMGNIKYYAQRGGFENTNIWHQEIADLNRLYIRSWPKDHVGNVKINFVAIASQSSSSPAGITFSSMRLTR